MRWAAGGLIGLAAIAVAQEHPERAARLLGMVATRCAQTDGRCLQRLAWLEYEQILAVTRTLLDPASFAAFWEEGEGMAVEQAVTYTLGEEEPGQQDVA